MINVLISRKCDLCGGRGWIWVGVGSNAEKEPCDLCNETGRLHVDWWAAAGVLTVLTSATVVIGTIVWLLNLIA